MTIYRLGAIDRTGEASEVVGTIREACETCSFAVLEIREEPTADQLTELAFATAAGKQVVIVDMALNANVNRMLLFHAGHYIGLCRPGTDWLALAEKVVEHACGERIAVVFPDDLIACLAQAESPIEARLAVHLCNQLFYTVTPQYEMAIGERNYRADFAISTEHKDASVIVEADGHEYHERTKDQAARDKSRDRAMLAAGYRVMRFTGREIWAAPGKCAREVYALMESSQ